MIQGIQHQVVQAVEGILAEVGQGKLSKLASLRVFFPHLLWPEGAPVHVVLEVVPDDVGLLQEEPHAVGQLHLQGQALTLLPRRTEQAGQTLAYHAGHKVAVAVVLHGGGGALAKVLAHKLRHARPHAPRDVSYHLARLGWQRSKSLGDVRESLQQNCFVALANPIHTPVCVQKSLLMEVYQQSLLLLGVLEGSHVVLHGVQPPQHQVEHQDVQAHLLRQLQDHRCKRARHLVEHILAELHVLIGHLEVLLHAPKQLQLQGSTELPHTASQPHRVNGHLAVGPLLHVLLTVPGPVLQNTTHSSTAPVLGRWVEAVDALHVHCLVGGESGLQALPPPHQPALLDDAEPGRPQQIWVSQHLVELSHGHVLHILHLLRVRLQVHLGLYEEDVVDLVFAPDGVGAVGHRIRGVVVQAGQELELVQRHLGGVNAQLVQELAHGCPLSTHTGPRLDFLRRVQL
mmetsp:Transcript_17637/g.25750  ORF Transcript_17637/g.25750 Transcript_17637/m.25750 type:complete len:457 (-) Transcript_17637:512-1882(-)